MVELIENQKDKMTMEEMCIKKKGFFREKVERNYYCKLVNSKNVNCLHLGPLDTNGKYTCRYRKKEEYIFKKHWEGFDEKTGDMK